MEINRLVRKAVNDVQQAVVDLIRGFDYDVGDTVDKAITKVRNTIESIANPLKQIDRINAKGPIDLAVKKIIDPIFEEPISKENCELADHLFRTGSGIGGVFYTHHAIYIGDGLVMHYAGKTPDIYIQATTFEEFAEGYQVYRYTEAESGLLFSREEAVNRAWQRCGEREYNLINNNCENFVRWCRAGTDTY